jgi:hypothetical protein
LSFGQIGVAMVGIVPPRTGAIVRAVAAHTAFLTIGFVCLIGHECSYAQEGDHSIADPLVVEPSVVEFGRVNNAIGLLELSFAVTNRSDRPIEITSARSGCGCTVARLTQPIVPPHGRVMVKATVSVIGRLGKFESHVYLDVQGMPKPIDVPIRGTVIQDLWFDGPMIQCFASETSPTTEAPFEIHTVDWPSVQFDWSVVDKDIKIEELSRTSTATETTIKFRVRLNDPKGRTPATWLLVLSPVDERIKSLSIPIVCYRSVIRAPQDTNNVQPKPRLNEQSIEAIPGLRPVRTSLGVIPRGEERRFKVTGDFASIESLKLVGFDDFPNDTAIEMHRIHVEEQQSIEFAVRLDALAPSGLFNGRIHLKAEDGKNFSIAVLGIVVPGISRANTQERKHVTGP